LIFWIPGIAGPVERVSPVSNLDIVPTLLDYLGLDENSPDEPLAGRSLRPVIESEELVPAFSFSAMGPYRSVNNERYKLVHHLGTRSYKLFDIVADPEESWDLLADQGENRELTLANRPELQGLKKELLRWISDVEGGVSRERRLKRAEEIEEELRSLGYLG
jgi:arylsulfatase A-like enzyme